MVAHRDPTTLSQATCVLIGAGAVLLRGAPGTGKSSLAASLLATADAGRLVRLIADDAVLLCAASGRVLAFAPEPIRGAVEMRGLGIVPARYEPRAVVRLVADLVDPDAVERLPGPAERRAVLCGVEVARVALPANDWASRDRVLAALAGTGGSRLADGIPIVAAMHDDSIRA